MRISAEIGCLILSIKLMELYKIFFLVAKVIIFTKQLHFVQLIITSNCAKTRGCTFLFC